MVDRAHIGRRFPPVSATVERGRLRMFLKAIGEMSPVHVDADAARAAGYRDQLVPPTYLFCLELLDAPDRMLVFDTLGIEIARVLHGEQSFAYRRPVVVGDRVTFAARIADIYDKKRGALSFVVKETDVTDEAGAPVAALRSVIVVRNGPLPAAGAGR
jgi:acyl dehydratase